MSVFKSLVQLAATAGVAGAIVASPIFTLKAEALTEAQVFERLSTIPVFAITNDQGALPFPVPKQANPKPEDPSVFVPFFLNPLDAESALKDVKAANPEIGKTLKISITSMNDVYKRILENKDKKIAVDFVPARTNLESAQTIWKAQGVPADKIPYEVPVFFAISGEPKKETFLPMTIDRDGKKETIVPFFFDKSDLQESIENTAKLNPEIAKSAKIQALPLSQILGSMVTKDDKPNPQIDSFLFMRSRTSSDYITKLSTQTAPTQLTTPK
jgi:hypothetical protein